MARRRTLDAKQTLDYHTIFETALALCVILTPDLKIAAVSNAYCEAIGVDREGLVGRDLFDILQSGLEDSDIAGANKLRQSLERVVRSASPDAVAAQKYYIRGPGDKVQACDWAVMNTPVMDDGKTVRWIHHRAEVVAEGVAAGTLTNGALESALARHRATEEELQSTRRFLDLIIENIPDMLFVKDAKDLRFVLMNRAGEELLGYDRSVLIGKNDYDFFPKDQADFFVERDREVLNSGELQITPEEKVESRTNGTRILQTKKMPVLDASGKPEFLLGLSEDITDKLASERQLQQAQKMEAIGQLTGGVAHDFNNLLTVILSNAEVLADGLGGNEDLRAAADLTRMAAERGAELTSSLLAFGRRQALEPRAVNINELISGMDGLLRRTLGDDIEIELGLGEGLWQSMIDSTRLESALLNLCLNARDAMPKGGQLSIETVNANVDQAYSDTHEDMTPGQWVLIRVSDTGTGMSNEVLTRAFEPFFSTKDIGEGTGLGLSMVYGFVNQSGGYIKIYSEIGLGTSFKIYLPRAVDKQTPAAEPIAREHRDPVGSETILMVEDNDLVRLNAERMLRTLGYQVLVAANGPEAMAIIEGSDPIDLLFTDVVMPGGMGGRELVEKAVAKRPALRILYTSGYTEKAIVHHGKLDPEVHLLRKPYHRRDLALKVRQVLEFENGID